MTLLIENRSESTLPPDIEHILTETLRLGLAHATAPAEVEISLSFVTPEEIRSLNNEYRGQDRETDVLSFPFYEPWEIRELKPNPGGETALGDIVICPPVAEAQAVAYGHSYIRELAFLAVHSLLHLLGYDHEDAEEERVMTEAQEAILQKAGIKRQ